MGFRFVVSTQVPGLRQVAKHLGVDEQGEVQQYVTKEILHRLPTYMPRKHGTLISKMHQTKRTMIQVDGPYARAQFFGVTKKGQPFKYDTSSNPKAGSHWDRRLIADEGAAIAAKVQRYVKSKGR